MRKLSVALSLLILAAAAPLHQTGAADSNTIAVLTFNVFDPFFGPEREQRMEQLPAAVMALQPLPDVMVFEEFFKDRDRERVIADLKAAGYPMATAHYVKRGYGTGVLVISRFPIEAADYTPYHTAGAVYDPEHYSGKGIIHCRLATPAGPLEFFATHPIARFKYLYDQNGAHVDRDRKTVDRLLEMERIARVILKKADPAARSVILAGDLNVSPDMWGYQYLLARTGMTDSYAALHPGESGSTYSPENTYVDKEWYQIDHVLCLNREGGAGTWLSPKSSAVVFKETVPLRNGKQVNLSDHFGLFTVFETVSDPAAVPMNPGFRPRTTGGSRSLTDLTAQGLALTPQNYLAWQAWAVDLMDKAERSYNRFCPEVIPAARTVIAGDVAAPVAIPLTALQREAIRMDLKKAGK
ncbi:MAG TPA: endonuclease/exonuclease/phosphatase family protein [bacterium]|nr:endonuclease/exonuclease/phosphatase family protein [bacterium]